ELTGDQLAYLSMYRSFHANMPPRSDVGAAVEAVRLCQGTWADAVTRTFLAVALRERDPEAAMAEVACAEEIARDEPNAFIRATVAGWGSFAILGLPTRQPSELLLAARVCRCTGTTPAQRGSPPPPRSAQGTRTVRVGF